jgi:electron transfer flavoprotein beta subunit
MNIAVCIKQVPASGDVSVDPVTHALVRDSAESMINPADLNALEEAISIRESHGGSVVVFTMGPPSAEKSLRTAIAIGADEAVLITDRLFAGADTIATARVLSRSVERFGAFDLAMTGARSSDGATGQVGPMMAEYLGVPHCTEVQKLEALSEGHLQILKKSKNALVRVRISLPALLTMCYGCNEPRLPTLRTQIGARRKTVARYTNSELGLPPESVGLSGSPTEVVDSFEPEGRKKAVFIEGSPGDIADRILELISEERANA